MTKTPQTGSAPTTGHMQAIVQDTYGAADVLELRTIERPHIEGRKVLIEVVAAGLDRGVEHLVTGMPYLVRLAGYGLTKPKTPVPGLDVAGRVVEVGEAVTRFAPGDEVFGIARGSYAEYAVADEDKLAHKPANVSFENAGVAAVSGITALQALTTAGNLQPGQHVLILGASGGVGSFAVQLAKALGGVVTGVAGTRNLLLVRSLGADHVIDYTREDFVDAGERYDLIVDTGGLNSLPRLRRALTADGTLVIVGGEGGNKLTGGIGRQIGALVRSPLTKQRLTALISKEQHHFMEELAGYMANGDVIPAIGQRFELAQVPDALRQMAAGSLSGKTAIVVNDEATGDVA